MVGYGTVLLTFFTQILSVARGQYGSSIGQNPAYAAGPVAGPAVPYGPAPASNAYPQSPSAGGSPGYDSANSYGGQNSVQTGYQSSQGSQDGYGQQQQQQGGYSQQQPQSQGGYGGQQQQQNQGGYGQQSQQQGGYQVGPTMQPSSCQYDQCFASQSNCALARSLPFQRQTPVSCTDCVNLCKATLNNTAPYQCRAAVYDSTYQSCDIFAVDGRTYPLVSYPNRDYFQPGPTCSGGGGGGGGDNSDKTGQCPSGQEPKILESKGYVLGVTDAKTIPSVTLKQCVDICKTNKATDGSAAPCLSFDYTESTQECKVSKQAAAPTGTGKLTAKDGAGYYEKICLPSNILNGCGDVFIRVPQSILVGFAQTVVDSKNEMECLDSCINSQQLFGFKCLSGMYYSDEPNQNCILNTQTKDSMPDLFVQEGKDIVDYFQIDCGGGGSGGGSGPSPATTQSSAPATTVAGDSGGGGNNALKRRFNLNRFAVLTYDRDRLRDIIESNKEFRDGLHSWTHWSSCNLEKDKMVRFRRCEESDIRLCPSNEIPCEKHPASVVRDLPEPPDDVRPEFVNKKSTSKPISSVSVWERRGDFLNVTFNRQNFEFANSIVVPIETSLIPTVSKTDWTSSGSRLTFTQSPTVATSERPSNLNQFKNVCRCVFTKCENRMRCDIGILERLDGTKTWCNNPTLSVPPAFMACL